MSCTGVMVFFKACALLFMELKAFFAPRLNVDSELFNPLFDGSVSFHRVFVSSFL